MRFPVVPVVITLVACGAKDVAGDTRNKTQLVVDKVETASGLRITLHDAKCPTRVTTLGGTRSSKFKADTACLSKLAVGSTIEAYEQRFKQGCMPGVTYRQVVGTCELGDLAMATTGAECK